MDTRTIRIGTSGWVYKQWAGAFYPKGWPKQKEFGYYVRHFPTVEINATFYRLPTVKMVRGWHDKAPDGFVYAVKGSRFLTHIKRLRDTSRGLRKYFRRLVPLRERTGPVLWQLPPNFVKNDVMFRRLDRFLARLPKEYRHAVEFRHPSWMDEETFGLLRRHRAAIVWLSSLRMPADHTITSDFVYLRFHGLKDGAYHDYTDAELEPWAAALARAARKGLPGYVYFNNDLNTRAPLNAASLMRLLGRHAVPPNADEPRTEMEDIPPAVRGDGSWPAWNRRTRAPAAKGRSRDARHRRRPPKRERGRTASSPRSRRLQPTA
ncbi:MAG TPA: DUF72 domain-containing protein [Opitutaceae bacterium]|nr:DUF72 domain-containing protein [Opitutaceae bacterium]